MLAKVDTNNSEINPYAPPTINDAADAKVRLSPEEPYRVVGKNLLCRVGCEQFPDVCWLTGITSDLVGVHRSKVRYLSETALAWLMGFKGAAVVAILLATRWIDMSIPVYAVGMAAFILGDGIYTHYFEKTLTIVVGESVAARRTRQLARVVPICLAGLALLIFVGVMAVDVVDTVLVMWAIAVVCIALLSGYLWMSPKNFTVKVSPYDEDTVIISGLNKEFLATIRNRDRSWMPVD